MAFNEPQTITISGSAISLPRTGMGTNTGTFTASDGTAKLLLTQQFGKRNRRTVRLEHAKIAADPISANNTRYSMSAYVVIDTPLVGYSVAEANAVVQSLGAWLTATSGANVQKLLGGEI